MLQDLSPAPGTFGDYLLHGSPTILIAALIARALAWLIRPSGANSAPL